MTNVVSTKVTHVNGKYIGHITYSYEYAGRRNITLEVTLDDNYGNLSPEDQEFDFSDRIQAALIELSKEPILPPDYLTTIYL